MSPSIATRNVMLFTLLLGACAGQNTEEITLNSRTGDAGPDADAADPEDDEAPDAEAPDAEGQDEPSPDAGPTTSQTVDDSGVGGGTDGAAEASIRVDAEVADASLPVHSDAGLCISAPASGGALPTTFRLSVYDTVTNMPIPGMHVMALDNHTGEQLSPQHQGDTDTRGQITFNDMPNDRPFGFKAVGGSNRWIDTYQFNYSTDPNNPRSTGLYVFVAGHEGFSAQSGEFTLRPDAGFVRGYIQWRGLNTLAASGVGCAAIGGAGLEDVRYTLDQPLPRPASERSPEQGTFSAAAGGFVIGNAASGKRVVTATLPDGTVIGSTSIVVFPRSASTDGLGNLVIASIFLDGAACARNPTPMSCQ